MCLSSFAWRINVFVGKNDTYEGVSLLVNTCAGIHVLAGAVVANASYHPAYGNMAGIDHDNDIAACFVHASRLLVKVD